MNRKLGAWALAALLTMGSAGIAAVATAEERHPEIEKAEMNLHQAKENLEHAAHDFGGHRVKALALVNQALG